MKTPQTLRKQAAELKQIAQHADGPAYHKDMQRVQALLTEAEKMENTGKSQHAANSEKKPKNIQQQRRNKDLAKIHLFKKQAGLDDDSYRDMLEQLTGKRSASKLNSWERGKVITNLKRSLPNQQAPHYPGRPNNIDSHPQLQKIEALLAEAKYPWSYAQSIAKRMHKKDKLEFCSADELSGIITALISDAKKHGRRIS